jgi:hypothetical protein
MYLMADLRFENSPWFCAILTLHSVVLEGGGGKSEGRVVAGRMVLFFDNGSG